MLTTTEITHLLVYLAGPIVGTMLWFIGFILAFRHANGRFRKADRESNEAFTRHMAIERRKFDEWRARIRREDHEHDEEGWQQ